MYVEHVKSLGWILGMSGGIREHEEGRRSNPGVSRGVREHGEGLGWSLGVSGGIREHEEG